MVVEKRLTKFCSQESWPSGPEPRNPKQTENPLSYPTRSPPRESVLVSRPSPIRNESPNRAKRYLRRVRDDEDPIQPGHSQRYRSLARDHSSADEAGQPRSFPRTGENRRESRPSWPRRNSVKEGRVPASGEKERVFRRAASGDRPRHARERETLGGHQVAGNSAPRPRRRETSVAESQRRRISRRRVNPQSQSDFGYDGAKDYQPTCVTESTPTRKSGLNQDGCGVPGVDVDESNSKEGRVAFENIASITDTASTKHVPAIPLTDVDQAGHEGSPNRNAG
jgi:hypothetical protein